MDPRAWIKALAGSVAPCAWLKAHQNLLNYTPSQFQTQIKFRSPSDYRDVFSRILLYLGTHTQFVNPEHLACLLLHTHHVSTNLNHPLTL